MPHECESCQRSLKGGTFTAPWADGDNPNGYITCPHCGHQNEIYDDD